MAMSEHAQAAKAIREELKKAFPGVNFKVTSCRESYYGVVRVETIHQFSREDGQEISKLLHKYEKGKFDGMTDSYDYGNVRTDIPQVRYVLFQVVPE